MKTEEYIKLYCKNCINKNTNLCEIRKNIENNYQCIEYKNIFKENDKHIPHIN